MSIKNLFSRNTGIQVPANELKRLTSEQVVEQFSDPHLALAITSSLAVVRVIKEEIVGIEKVVLKEAKLRPEFQLLESIPGIGQTLALTIMYEAGSMTRFTDAGHFCSYCRCVPSQYLSNGKVKGSGNVRNGNPYLSWAFTEAAHFAIRFEPLAKRFYERKKARTNELVALRTISHKLARASFYILQDRVPFRPERAFG